MTNRRASILGIITTVLVFLAPGLSTADTVPWNDLSDLVQKAICAGNPQFPNCRQQCPPMCLGQIDENLKKLKEIIEPKMRQQNISIESRVGGVTLRNSRGLAVSYDCERIPVPSNMENETTARFLNRCRGKVGVRRFRWTVSEPLDRNVSRDGARQFKRFVNAANRAYKEEMDKIFVTGAQNSAAEDEEICAGFATAGLISGGPFGGALVGALCLWFASNGLD